LRGYGIGAQFHCRRVRFQHAVLKVGRDSRRIRRKIRSAEIFEGSEICDDDDGENYHSHKSENRAYAQIQKYLEDNGFEINSAEFVRIPNDYKTLTDEQRESVQKLIDKIEEDEDVQNVFTNMAD